MTLHPINSSRKNQDKKIMKTIKIVVLSLAALAFGAPVGFRTANVKRKPKLAAEPAAPAVGEPTETEKEKIADDANLPEATKLLIKGAGVDAKDVVWRIRAGLTPAQAVEVAANEKAEAEAAK